jgi:hypothetical protein
MQHLKIIITLERIVPEFQAQLGQQSEVRFLRQNIVLVLRCLLVFGQIIILTEDGNKIIYFSLLWHL